MCERVEAVVLFQKGTRVVKKRRNERKGDGGETWSPRSCVRVEAVV